MLNRIVAWFSAPAESPIERERRARVAAATMLLELALADKDFKSLERARILRSLQTDFELSSGEAKALLAEASDVHAERRSLDRLAHCVRTCLSAEDRQKVATALWKLAKVDGRIDASEAVLVDSFTALLGLDKKALALAREAAFDSRTVLMDDDDE